MLVIAAFTILSGLTYAQTGSRRINVQGTPLGLMLAAVLLGAAPAAVLGAVTVCFVQLRLRSPAHYFRNNLITFIWFPLVGGLVFHDLVTAFGVHHSDLGFYVLVVPAFMTAIAVNFLGVAGYQCWLERSPLRQAVRDTLFPVLSAELFASLLTMGAVWISVRTGALGMALLGLIFLVYQSLAGELLKSKSRATDLQRMATTDGLTGLANRGALTDHVAAAIAESHTGTNFAVILIDLDRFKEINDTLGHHYGDELLCETGRRLEACVGPGGVVARLGGDEFVVLVKDTTDDPEVLLALAERLLECVRAPLNMDEIAISVGSSIGIARFPQDGRDMNELMRRADVAMYAAKESLSGCKLYAADLDHHSVRRLSLLGDVTRALSADELVVHFQPIISADDFSIHGAEGLVRWQHPEHGLLAPGAFIDSVEATPMIHPLTLVVLERSIEQCAQWRRAGRDLYVAVNLSVRNLHNPGLPDEIAALLTTYGLEPSALKLEITESMIMADPDLVTKTIEKLNWLGVRLSVDDFGTGFSSLGYLKNLPIEELKIDRSFISQMLSNESDLIIVRSTINLGHDLGLRVVAEGVEDAATLSQLSGLGCDLIQGFHVSKPLAGPAFTDWLLRSIPARAAQAGPWVRPVPAPPDAPWVQSGAQPGPGPWAKGARRLERAGLGPWDSESLSA
jgi:diguanylate cyclase (GGDEF)-like protein